MSHEENLHRGRVGVMDLTWMKRQAEAQLGWKGAHVADAAMPSEEATESVRTLGDPRKYGKGSNSGSKWSSRLGGQRDHTEQLGSSEKTAGKIATQRHRAQVGDAITHGNWAQVDIMDKMATQKAKSSRGRHNQRGSNVSRKRLPNRQNPDGWNTIGKTVKKSFSQARDRHPKIGGSVREWHRRRSVIGLFHGAQNEHTHETTKTSEQRHADGKKGIPRSCVHWRNSATEVWCRTHSFELHSNQSARQHRQSNLEPVVR